MPFDAVTILLGSLSLSTRSPGTFDLVLANRRHETGSSKPCLLSGEGTGRPVRVEKRMIWWFLRNRPPLKARFADEAVRGMRNVSAWVWTRNEDRKRRL